MKKGQSFGLRHLGGKWTSLTTNVQTFILMNGNPFKSLQSQGPAVPLFG